MELSLKEGFRPGSDERLCAVSFVLAFIRLGGGPEEKSGFWPAYREALRKNEETDYRNVRVEICRPIIEKLLKSHPHLFETPLYYRDGRLSESHWVESLREILAI